MAAWITRMGVRYANEVAVEQMITAAVKVEREACATVAHAMSDEFPVAAILAKAIRDRHLTDILPALKF